MPTDRDCVCTTCDGKRTPLVLLLRKLSLEFAAQAEEYDAELGTRAIAISKAFLDMAKRAEAHGDASILGALEPVFDVPLVVLDIEATLRGENIDVPVEVAHV